MLVKYEPFSKRFLEQIISLYKQNQGYSVKKYLCIKQMQTVHIRSLIEKDKYHKYQSNYHMIIKKVNYIFPMNKMHFSVDKLCKIFVIFKPKSLSFYEQNRKL